MLDTALHWLRGRTGTDEPRVCRPGDRLGWAGRPGALADGMPWGLTRRWLCRDLAWEAPGKLEWPLPVSRRIWDRVFMARFVLQPLAGTQGEELVHKESPKKIPLGVSLLSLG